MQRAADSSRGSSTSALLVDTLKSNFAEQVALYERKIRELNRVSYNCHARGSSSNRTLSNHYLRIRNVIDWR